MNTIKVYDAKVRIFYEYTLWHAPFNYSKKIKCGLEIKSTLIIYNRIFNCVSVGMTENYCRYRILQYL